MKIISLTPQIEGQFNGLIDETIAAIETFKKGHDKKQFKEALCEIIDRTPSVAFLDPDILYASYDIDVEYSRWCEFTDKEESRNKETLKELVNDMDDFASHQLSSVSSGSLLYTLFGDAYSEIGIR